MTKPNGETKIDAQDLDISAKLDMIIEALRELKEDNEDFREEVGEKFSNLSISRDELDFLEEN